MYLLSHLLNGRFNVVINGGVFGWVVADSYPVAIHLFLGRDVNNNCIRVSCCGGFERARSFEKRCRQVASTCDDESRTAMDILFKTHVEATE